MSRGRKRQSGLWTWLMLVWPVYLLLRCNSVCSWRQIYLIRQESTSWAPLIGEERRARARSLVTNQMCDDFATTKSHLEASRTFKTVHCHSWNSSLCVLQGYRSDNSPKLQSGFPVAVSSERPVYNVHCGFYHYSPCSTHQGITSGMLPVVECISPNHAF